MRRDDIADGMTEWAQIAATSWSSVLLFGAASSVHCVSMCGPLSMCCTPTPAATAAYHGGRFTGYVAAGAALGAAGAGLGDGLSANGIGVVAPYVAIGLAAVLVLQAAGIGSRLRIPLPGFVTNAFRALGRWPLLPRATGIGLLTALLPCGVLYAAYALALTSGGVATGAALTAAFALGSLPLLALAQWRFAALRVRLGASRMALLQRVLLLAAAATLVWRAVADFGGGSCCGGAD